MLRLVLGTLAGIAAAVVVVAVGEWVGHAVFPPPPGIDLAKPKELESLIAKLPAGAIVSVLVAWAAGSFAGGAVASLATGRRWAAWSVGVAMLAAGSASMLAIPHPLWFVLISVPAALAPAWLAGRLFARTA